MMAAQRTAQAPRHKKIIARFASRSAYPSGFLDESGDAHGDNRRPPDVAGFAANHGDAETARSFLDSSIKPRHPPELALGGHEQSHERKLRQTRHGGEVAQRPSHCLP